MGEIERVHRINLPSATPRVGDGHARRQQHEPPPQHEDSMELHEELETPPPAPPAEPEIPVEAPYRLDIAI